MQRVKTSQLVATDSARLTKLRLIMFEDVKHPENLGRLRLFDALAKGDAPQFGLENSSGHDKVVIINQLGDELTNPRRLGLSLKKFRGH